MVQNNIDKVSVAYSGVHQAYQIALAAYEVNCLDYFYCSLFADGNTWGRKLSYVLKEAMVSRTCPGLPASKVVEHPWPFLRYQAGMLMKKRDPYTWTQVSKEFDDWAANRLKSSASSIFIGVETCACSSFQVASQRGMTTVLDCPQVHPTFLNNILAVAAEDLKISAPPPIDSPDIAARKLEEFRLADHLLVLSNFQKRSFLDAGVQSSRLNTVTLWADPELWYPSSDESISSNLPLKVLYVGSIDLRKGIPYLLESAKECKSEVALTLVGSVANDLKETLGKYSDLVSHLTPQSKNRLRELYWGADVLVLPSLCDTFGFVAMEAMACGIPIIVSENCGVPVPDESWRVPIMDPRAITERLLLYARDRDLCREHGRRASDFAMQWTPQSYRKEIGRLLQSLLN